MNLNSLASQLNNLQRQQLKLATVTVFDTLGRLNEYLALIKAGTMEPPTDERLRRHALEGIVIADAEGDPYGAEKFLSVFLGLLVPPSSSRPWMIAPLRISVAR
jgi:hypothetical protein